jgi:hypothetical protein
VRPCHRHAHLRHLSQKFAFDDEAKNDSGELGKEDDVEDYLVPLAGGSLRTSI